MLQDHSFKGLLIGVGFLTFLVLLFIPASANSTNDSNPYLTGRTGDPKAAEATGDNNRLFNLEDAAGMFNERGYAKANSYSLDGNEIINDFNGNLMYSQRLMYLPISENGLHADLKLAYNGDVSHVAFGARSDANGIYQTPLNHPEWIISLNGIAIQTFNFENELISWRTSIDSISQDDDVASLVEGYHKCYRVSSSGGIPHGVISILMEDGSVREYYSISNGINGPAYMKGGEYNSCSKDDPDRGYLWSATDSLYGYFTLFRSDGTRVLFKLYQPTFRTNLDCTESFPSTRDDYPRILLPVKFQDQMGHEITLSYAYKVEYDTVKVESDTVLGRPFLTSAGDFGFSWSDSIPRTTNSLRVSLPGSGQYTIYFANRVTEAGLQGRGASWRGDINRGLVWWIIDPKFRSTKFTYRPCSRIYWIKGIEDALRTHNVCGSTQKKAGAVFKLEPWRIWKIQYPEGGQEFVTYYKDPATAWGQTAYIGSKDTVSIEYDYDQNCELNEGNRFPCKKTAEFDVIGRDPFFLNMVVAARRTLDGTSVVNTDSLMFSWEDTLSDLSINSGDQFVTQRWFGKDSLGSIPQKNQDPQIKSRELVYRYYPEKGPFSSRSRDRGWALKMVSSHERDRYVDGNQVTKNYYWNTNYGGDNCCGTLLLDSLRTTYDTESIWERYAYSWLGSPSSETVNNMVRREVIDPWSIMTETYYDTSFMRLGGSSDSYYSNGPVDSVLTKRNTDNVLLTKNATQYCSASASDGYVGQPYRTSTYLVNSSGEITDSVTQSSSYFKSDAPAAMYQGATKSHTDPNGNNTYFYCPEGSEPVSFRLQTHDGSDLDSTLTANYWVTLGPFWYMKQSQVGSQTLTWFQAVDERGRLRWVVEPNGYRSEAFYDGLNRMWKVVLPGGFMPKDVDRTIPPNPDTSWSILNFYDDDASSDPVCVTQHIRLGHSQPSQTSRVWIDGLSRSYQHDTFNSPDTTHDSVITGYDYAGRGISTQDQLGFVTTSQYDHLDRTVKTVYPDSSLSSDSTKYSVTNAQSVGLASMFNFPTGIIFAQESIDENANKVMEYYDARKKLRLRNTFDGQTPLSTYFDYDDLGNLILVIRPNGDSLRYAYNSLGQLMWEEAADYTDFSTGGNYGRITYEYDKNGNLTRKVDPSSAGTLFLPYNYYVYDALNRVVESGRKAEYYPDRCWQYRRYFYDQSCSELSRERLSLAFSIDQNGICDYAERYDYDPRGRIKRQVNYFYAVLDSTGSPNWQYKASGDSVVILYTYDWADQLKSITYPDGMVVTYNYDSRGRLTTVGGVATADSAKYAQLAYTHRNQMESMKLGGTLQQVDYAYNQRGWLQSINGGSSSSGGAPNDVFGQALYYDIHPSPPTGWSAQYNGNLFGQKVSMLGQDTTFAYRYDESDRLKDVQRGSNPFEAFTYDANGNFLSRTNGSTTTSYTYTTGTNKVLRVDKPSPLIDDTLFYNRNGNVKRHSGKKVSTTYDAYDQMRLVEIPGSLGTNAIWYGYNTSGERIYKAYRYYYQVYNDPEASPGRNGGGPPEEPGPPLPPPGTVDTCFAIVYTYYVVGQGQVLAEQTGVSPSSARLKSIYAGSSRIAMRDATQKLHYFLNDHLGSARVVIDSTGLVKDKYWYYAFGESRNAQVSTGQSYRYTSKPLDNDGGINIYYYGARYYDPELGRFWAIDPAASKYPGWSPYAYCADNPVGNVDPSGASFMGFMGGLATGEWEAVKSAGAGLVGLATDPGTALAGMSTLFTDLPAVVSAIADNVSTTWKSGDDGKGQVIGRIAGEITLAFVASKGFDKLGKIASASSAVESGIERAGRLGRAGEEAVGVAGAKTRVQVPGTNRFRVPDKMTGSTLTEVKNVSKLSYGQQLRDYTTIANSENLTFELWVRPSTQLSGPLNQAITRGAISLRYIP